MHTRRVVLGIVCVVRVWLFNALDCWEDGPELARTGRSWVEISSAVNPTGTHPSMTNDCLVSCLRQAPTSVRKPSLRGQVRHTNVTQPIGMKMKSHRANVQRFGGNGH